MCSLLAYRKVTHFCKLILYPPTLLKLFIVSRSFRIEFFGSLRCRIMSSANRDTLTVSLPMYIAFITSSCLIALASKSSTLLNRSGKSEHSCLFPDFRENVFSFSPLSVMLAIDLSYLAFTCSGTFLLFIVFLELLS
jgi:hypothetical protein